MAAILRGRRCPADPHARVVGQAAGVGQAEVGEDVDHELLDRPHVGHRVGHAPDRRRGPDHAGPSAPTSPATADSGPDGTVEPSPPHHRRHWQTGPAGPPACPAPTRPPRRHEGRPPEPCRFPSVGRRPCRAGGAADSRQAGRGRGRTSPPRSLCTSSAPTEAGSTSACSGSARRPRVKTCRCSSSSRWSSAPWGTGRAGGRGRPGRGATQPADPGVTARRPSPGSR